MITACFSETEERARKCLSYLPCALSGEIRRLCSGRVGGLGEIREIRVRRGGACSLIMRGESIPLGASPSAEEMDEVLMRLCEGSLYAHRENIAAGYIPIGDGIRVGVCGLARYEKQGIVGISETSGFVFRIPGHECAFERELFAVWDMGVRSGMLIYSPPGVGKTTALRSLARYIGSGKRPRRVVAVDERCEFSEGDYRGAQVDILRGYRKSDGLEIAARTLSPEVVMVDEVGANDVDALLGAIRCGVPVIATAHASCLEELSSASSVSRIIDSGIFDTFVGISADGGRYSLRVERE